MHPNQRDLVWIELSGIWRPLKTLGAFGAPIFSVAGGARAPRPPGHHATDSKAEPRILQKHFFLFWCKNVEWNPIRNQNEFHDYHVQKETEGIPAKLASFPKHDP